MPNDSVQERFRPLSAALRALCIAEVASAIANYVLRDSRSVRHAQLDLLAMALTCKALYEPAMDVRWYAVDDFNQLLACLPRHLWRARSPCDDLSGDGPKSFQVMMLQESSESEDWTRFEHCAGRVRRLKFDTRSCIDSAAFRVFSEAYSGAQSPFVHLRWLKATCSLEEAMKCNFLFISPLVRECSFPLAQFSREPAAIDFIKSLSHLKSLKISSSFSAGDIIPTEHISSTLIHLNTLDLGYHITAQNLLDLRHLPHLRTLRVGMVEATAFTLPIEGSGIRGFPSLEYLYVEHFHDISLPSAFLRSIKGSLRTVHIGSDYGSVSATIFPRVLSALNLHHELRELRLYGGYSPSDGIPLVHVHTLTPLFACTKLVALSLHRMNIQIGRDEVKTLGVAWPQLEELQLTENGSHESYEHPKLSLADLREFAVHFPHLTSLLVPFDAKDGISMNNLPHVYSTTVASIGIPFCPLPEAESPSVCGEVAAFISEVFPNAKVDLALMQEYLSEDRFWPPDGEDQDAWERALLKQWNTVSALIVPFKLAKERAIVLAMAAESVL